jgi:predicted RNase H-like nuclease
MTIGLPERIGPEGRAPERLIRRALGARRSSVFSTPCRAAVYAASYPEACAAARAHSDPPRALSKQAFNIFPKMREIDGLLRARPALRPVLREVHPETTFCVLNGDRPMTSGKKTQEGVAERMAILRRAGIPDGVVTTRLRGAAADDVIDALAVLVTTHRIHNGMARVFGVPGDVDEFGFPCAISA